MSKTVSVYFDDSEKKTYDDAMALRVNPQWGKKISPYIVDLVKRDLASNGPTVEPKDDVVIQLARLFHPTLVRDLESLMTGRVQGRVVARFLEALTEALQRSDEFDPAAPFHLYSSLDQLTAQVTQTAPGITLMKSLAQYLQTEHEPFAGEHPPTDPGASSTSDPAGQIIADEDKRRAKGEAPATYPAAARKRGGTERNPRKTKS